jgi:acetyltransferase
MCVDDAAMHDAFIAALGPDDLRFRFGSRIEALPDAERYDVAKVDHEKEVTFVATVRASAGACEIVGEVRLREDAYDERAEFAIAIRPDFQRKGLGRALLEKLVEFCRTRPIRMLYGLVDPSNTGMLALARRLGFEIDQPPGEAPVVVSVKL